MNPNIKQPYAFKKRRPIDLSLSENPLGCSPRVFAALKQSLNQVSEYPDANLTRLKQAISQRFKVPVSKISISNGSEALIDLLARRLLGPQTEAIIPETSFPLFEKGVLLSRAEPVFAKMTPDLAIDLKAVKKKINQKTKLIFLCNPNNPTGKVLVKNEIIKFTKAVSPIIVLVDEANIEFGGQSVIRETKRFKNLVVLRSFSKGFGLAGLRIGFAIGPQSLIADLEGARCPFPCSILAEPAAIAALEDQRFVEKSKRFMTSQRQFLTRELKKRGFGVIGSQANNLLVKFNSPGLTQLLQRKGVSVVNGANFRGLSNNFIRLTPRLPRVNKQFLKAIDEILKEGA